MGERHVVARPLTEAGPVARIGIPLVRGRVVVPRRDVENTALRQQRLHVLGVVVGDVPAEVPVHAVERLDVIVRIDHFHALPFAAVVQVGLEDRHADVFLEDQIPVDPGIVLSRRDVEILHVADALPVLLVLRYVPFRIEPQPQARAIGNGLLLGRVVHVEADFRPSLEQEPGVLRENVARLAERVFAEAHRVVAHDVGVFVEQARGRVMDDREAFR